MFSLKKLSYESLCDCLICLEKRRYFKNRAQIKVAFLKGIFSKKKFYKYRTALGFLFFNESFYTLFTVLVFLELMHRRI